MSAKMKDVKNAYVLGKRRSGKGTRTYAGIKFTDKDGTEKFVIQPGVSISGTVVFKEPDAQTGEEAEAAADAEKE